MKYIKLSGKYGLGKHALVDDEDFELVNKYNWCVHNDKVRAKLFYAVCHQKNKKSNLRMHRFILKVNSKEIVDHINCNGLDNRKENLRIVTNQQNQWNRSNKNRGVIMDNRKDYLKKRWIAQIKFNYKNIFLGRFKTKDEALNARHLKQKELYKM